MKQESKVFLSAQWRHLILLNFAVDDSVLRHRLPPGCELDRWRGQAYVSLVAFQFLDTRVCHIRWPGFTNFPEVNLRFYVRHRGQRGVCFVGEFVPSRLVAKIARILYNEPYRSASMGEDVTLHGTGSVHAHYWARASSGKLWLEVKTGADRSIPAPDSLEHFFKEHEMGFGQSRGGKLLTYRVWHPTWKVAPVLDYQFDVDWAELYGADFAPLEGCTPQSVVFAFGSEIRVFQASKESLVP